MPSASSCLLHVLCFTEYPYQTESKWDKNEWSLFLEYLENLGERSTRNGVRGGNEVGGRAPDPRGPPIRRLMPFFDRKKANFMRKIWAKDSPQSELRISGLKETVKGKNQRTQKQRETEIQIQSRRGSRPSHAMEAKEQRGNPSPI